MDELKPCPCCRSANVYMKRDCNNMPHNCTCRDCGCRAPYRAWNTRTPDPASIKIGQSDELKPVAWMYDHNGTPNVYVYQLPDWWPAKGTETPLYGPEALIAIARAMQERCAGKMPCTAENPDESSRERGRFDGIMEFQRTIRALDPEALVREYMEKK